MDYKDYYKISGLEKNASEADIKKAFRKLAVKYHPDKNPGDKKAEEKFKEINEANDVLSDSEKRKKYDELGENWKYYQQHGGNPGNFDRTKWGNTGQPFNGGFNQADFEDNGSFSDFFESLFGERLNKNQGSRPKQRRAYRGEDLRAELEISLEDAFHGGGKQISLDGQKINLKLKPGLRDGQVLRMKGKGGEGRNGGENGDLLITMVIGEHPRFKRKENDLYFDNDIDVYTAVLGGKISVQTMDKTIQMNIPEGTDSDKTFRLKGMGMPLYESPEKNGDAFVRLVIKTPKNLSAKEKELFIQLSDFKKTTAMITLYDHMEELLEDENKRSQDPIALTHLVSELMEDLGYCDETDINKALLRAFEVCCTLQISIPSHFKKIYRLSDDRLQVDWQVSDLACYLLLINGNSCNPNVARAQLRAIISSRSQA